MILAVLCISAMIQQPGLTTVYRCQEPVDLPKAIVPVELVPVKPVTHIKVKPKIVYSCRSPKHLYHHRRGHRTWTTCK